MIAFFKFYVSCIAYKIATPSYDYFALINSFAPFKPSHVSNALMKSTKNLEGAQIIFHFFNKLNKLRTDNMPDTI